MLMTAYIVSYLRQGYDREGANNWTHQSEGSLASALSTFSLIKNRPHEYSEARITTVQMTTNGEHAALHAEYKAPQKKLREYNKA